MMNFFKNVFGYNAIRGAVIVKLVQLALQASGHAPWSDSQASAVEEAVNAAVAILGAFGVNQAHNADPKAK